MIRRGWNTPAQCCTGDEVNMAVTAWVCPVCRQVVGAVNVENAGTPEVCSKCKGEAPTELRIVVKPRKKQQSVSSKPRISRLSLTDEAWVKRLLSW
jgi:hypothetical protein